MARFRPIVRRRKTAPGQDTSAGRLTAVPATCPDQCPWPLPSGSLGNVTQITVRTAAADRVPSSVSADGTNSAAVIATVVTAVQCWIDFQWSPLPPWPWLPPVTSQSFSGCHFSGPIPADRRSDHRLRRNHSDFRFWIYPPVPFPVSFGSWLPPSAPELFGFRGEFPQVAAAVTVADYPSSFTVPLSTDPDHRMALWRSRSSGPTRGRYHRRRASSRADIRPPPAVAWVVTNAVEFVAPGSTVAGPRLQRPCGRAGFVSGHLGGARAWQTNVRTPSRTGSWLDPLANQLSDLTELVLLDPFQLLFRPFWAVRCIILDTRDSADILICFSDFLIILICF